MAKHSTTLLREIVDGLDRPYGVERSVKLSFGKVLRDRYLLTLHKSSLGAAPLDRLLDIGGRFDLPKAFADQIAGGLPDANIVHLGFEAEAERSLCKIYLEFAQDFASRRDAAYQAGETLLLYRAYKWNSAQPGENAITDYLCPPIRTEAEIRTGIADAGGGGPAAAVAIAILAEAVRRVAPVGLMFMRVEEFGNPRRSFDLNIYNADLTGADIAGPMAPLWQQLNIPADEAAEVAAAIRGEEIGHISGGTGRDGADFLTIYFGVEGR